NGCNVTLPLGVGHLSALFRSFTVLVHEKLVKLSPSRTGINLGAEEEEFALSCTRFAKESGNQEPRKAAWFHLPLWILGLQIYFFPAALRGAFYCSPSEPNV